MPANSTQISNTRICVCVYIFICIPRPKSTEAARLSPPHRNACATRLYRPNYSAPVKFVRVLASCGVGCKDGAAGMKGGARQGRYYVLGGNTDA